MNVIKNKKNKIISSIRETIESSSVHAIPNISRNKYKLIKIVWFFFFLASSSICGYLIFLTIDDYLSREIVTKIIVKEVPSMGKKY